MKLLSAASAALLAHQQLLVITPNRLDLAPNACLSETYLGEYGTTSKYHVYRNTYRCALSSIESDGLDYRTTHVLPIDQNQVALHLQDAGVDDSLRTGEPSFSESLELLEKQIVSFVERESTYGSQSVLQNFPSMERPQILQLGSNALLTVSQSILPIIDTLLPRFLVPVLLSDSYGTVPVPDEAVKRVQDWLSSLSFDADIAATVEHLSVFNHDITTLYTS